ncbi:hypothetical protein R3P38DRAFT_3605428 [Favolaschia claudopus]|uniref:Uncharacterized protein n=1 Tax=Favolaschia claudopus TaxID=2862362 RepID=A0AAW0A9E1_9AGAR
MDADPTTLIDARTETACMTSLGQRPRPRPLAFALALSCARKWRGSGGVVTSADLIIPRVPPLPFSPALSLSLALTHTAEFTSPIHRSSDKLAISAPSISHLAHAISTDVDKISVDNAALDTASNNIHLPHLSTDAVSITLHNQSQPRTAANTYAPALPRSLGFARPSHRFRAHANAKSVDPLQLDLPVPSPSLPHSHPLTLQLRTHTNRAHGMGACTVVREWIVTREQHFYLRASVPVRTSGALIARRMLWCRAA